jgi:ubiquinol-cytochrome c reductase iron-sulfur subunit
MGFCRLSNVARVLISNRTSRDIHRVHGKEPSMNPTLPITCPSVHATPSDPDKRLWLIATGVAGGTAALATAVPFVSTFAPSERAKAAGGPVEVDISDIPPGGSKTVEWRGKPVWVARRTPEMLATLQGLDAELVDPKSLKDQQPDYARNAARSIEPEVFVAVGICTHLGCSPTAVAQGSGNPSVGADWPGGYFCPCHGSTFDVAGRAYKNKPAPTNLEVPPHRYVSASRILIGDDSVA